MRFNLVLLCGLPKVPNEKVKDIHLNNVLSDMLAISTG